MSKTGKGRLSLAAVITVITLVLVAACTAASPQQGATAAAPEQAATLDATQQALAPGNATLGSQRHGDLLAWLSSNPAQPVRGTAEMDAYLVNADGQPITDASVTFDTDMTNMSHGLNQVTAESAGDGHYVGQVRFMMGGPWRVIAIVERPGQETAKLRFEFTVKTR